MRLAEMAEASTNASGLPSAMELSTMLALARCLPAATFPGKLAIHFIPAAGCSPPRGGRGTGAWGGTVRRCCRCR